MPGAARRDRAKAETETILAYRRAGISTVNLTTSELGRTVAAWWRNNLTPEMEELRRKGLVIGRSRLTPERASAIGRIAYSRGLAKLTREQRQENGRKNWSVRTLPDGRRVRTPIRRSVVPR